MAQKGSEIAKALGGAREARGSRPFGGGRIMMTVILIIGTITGLVLGLRFSVFVLAPAIFSSLTGLITIGVLNGHDARTITLMILAALASVQVGYLTSCVFQASLSSRAVDRRKSSWQLTRQ